MVVILTAQVDFTVTQVWVFAETRLALTVIVQLHQHQHQVVAQGQLLPGQLLLLLFPSPEQIGRQSLEQVSGFS